GLYGIWQTTRIIVGYASFINLGMPFYVQREYPAFIKEAKIDEANNIAHQVISFSFISFPVIALILIGVGLYFPNDFEFSKSMVAIAIWFVLTIPAGIGTIINKATNDYKTVGIGESLFGIGSILLVPFMYYYGFNALLVGFLATTVAQSWYYYKHRPVKYKWYWNTGLLKGMIFTAFPIFLVNIASSVFASADRIIIASMLDFRDVGLYSLSAFISIPISMVVTSFSMVLFTQLNERFGRSVEHHVIEKHVFIPQKIFSNFLPPIIGMGLIAMPLLTQLFLPKYQEGIQAAQINIFAIFFYMLASFSANALFVLNKQKLSALSFFVAGIIKVAGSILAISFGYGISGVAFFSVLGYFIYDSLMLYFVTRSLGYNLYSFVKQLLIKLWCPTVILASSILYVSFYKEVYGYFGIQNVWIQLLLGELFIIIIGFYFFLKAYKIINSFIRGKNKSLNITT
ncbi:MAG: polysaccharide biosynthesis C-terminal domain-containing protein, partial [Bacteroidota bacterium]